jgi:hypothetical protein
MMNIRINEVYVIRPGDQCTLLLPDGTQFSMEQTADDFSLVHLNDQVVAYTCPTSAYAKSVDADRPSITGRK